MVEILSSKDAQRVAQLHQNCYKVMLRPCTKCGKKLTADSSYEWALVCLISEDNLLDAEEQYVVKVDNLRNARDKTFAKTLGNDGGRFRVSFLHSCITCFTLKIFF